MVKFRADGSTDLHADPTMPASLTVEADVRLQCLRLAVGTGGLMETAVLDQARQYAAFVLGNDPCPSRSAPFTAHSSDDSPFHDGSDVKAEVKPTKVESMAAAILAATMGIVWREALEKLRANPVATELGFSYTRTAAQAALDHIPYLSDCSDA